VVDLAGGCNDSGWLAKVILVEEALQQISVLSVRARCTRCQPIVDAENTLACRLKCGFAASSSLAGVGHVII
jgi:hypothetical protein